MLECVHKNGCWFDAAGGLGVHFVATEVLENTLLQQWYCGVVCYKQLDRQEQRTKGEGLTLPRPPLRINNTAKFICSVAPCERAA